MSILDTFYILFKTDADKAAADTKKLGDAADQTEDKLRKTDATSQKLAASFINMAKAAAAPLLALASFGTLANIAVERAAAIRELDSFSAKLNSSISDVDAFQRSVKELGGETAGAVDSLSKIAEKVNEAFSDKESGARKDFDKWKLSFKDVKGEALGATDSMLALAGNLEKVSRAEALARIKKLGIEDATTIDLLLRGRRELEEYMRAQKESGVVTEEQALAVREYYGELGRASNGLTSIGNRIVATFLPAITKVVAVFGDLVGWMNRNRTIVQGFFIGVAAVVTAYFLPAMAAAAAAVIAATWPFLAIGAAIAAVGAAFALAYEDVVAFMNGQPSLIGELVKRYEWFADIIRGIGDLYNWLEDAAGAALSGIKSAWDLFVSASETAAQAQQDFWSNFKPIWESIKNLISSVGELASAVLSRIGIDVGALVSEWSGRFSELSPMAERVFGDMLAAIGLKVKDITAFANVIKDAFVAAFNWIKSVWDSTIGGIASTINGIAQRIQGLANSVGSGGPVNVGAGQRAIDAGASVGAMIGPAQRALNGASTSPISNVTPGGGQTNIDQSRTTTVGAVNVTVKEGDGKAIARTVRQELQNQFRTTSSKLDDGVDR